MLLEVRLECGEVVADGGVHGVHHRAHRIVHVDHTRIGVIDAVVDRGHHAKKRGIVLRFLLDGQGIGGQRVLLHRGDEQIDAVGQRQNQGDADDTDTARKGGQKGSTLLGHQVLEGQRESRCEGHRAFALARAVVVLFLFCLFLRDGGGVRQGVLLLLLLGVGVGVAHDLTVYQAHDAVGVALGQLGVVGDHQNELILGDLLEDVHDLNARDGVQRACGLVGQQNIGVVDQCASDGHALHLTARHLVGLFVDLIAQSHLLQRIDGAATALGAGNAREGQRQFDVGKNGLVGNEVVALKDESDGVIAVGVPVAVGVLLGGAAVDDQVAVGVTIQTAENVEQRGFTTARRAEDRDELVVAEGKVNAAQGVDAVLIVADRIGLYDVFELQHI